MRKRADVVLVERGIVETRAKAQEAIAAGGLKVNGAVVTKSAELIDPEAVLELNRPHPWVSRGGLKLDHALKVFGVKAAGRVCMDVGASTGGFTDVLLAHGAKRVFAVDGGRDQLHPRLALDSRVVRLEGVDARDLSTLEIPEPPDLVVCDASFIGLDKILPRPLSLAAPAAELIALVKPQYESGPGKKNKGGLVADEDARRIAEEAAERVHGIERFLVREFTASPVRGGDGNREFLLLARREAPFQP
jgi:23S rRNA (cytidine1920-2'-O)/16S rRNA (cytidine1409-2'-O)-methyltransferase